MRNPFDKSSILLIYTGGTIGMKEDPKTQALAPFDFSQILQEVPELRKFSSKIDSYTFDPLIDSSDVEPSMWVKLAELIKEKYEEYDGFIVLHGTDTMAYSASALSFMLDHLRKPVVFTGSQLPIGSLRTDGRENLISAVEIATARDRHGKAVVPEVCIFFNSQLLRGNRSCKVNSTSFDAFRSPNWPALADAGISIRYHEHAIHYPAILERKLEIHTNLDTRVAILKIHPGITAQVARNVLLGEGIRAVILETYGSGNAISKPWFTDIVKEATAAGKILLNVTQCLAGEVNMGLYATGKALADSGVISGGDMTTEGALGKLFVLMGEYPDNEKVKALLEKNLKGEISK
ncbi:MAG: type I asparaginase [Bacteroidales bacterium]|nr:type I asparaginase [Bacteroidales bacterium]